MGWVLGKSNNDALAICRPSAHLYSLVASTWPVFPIEQFIFFRPLAFPAAIPSPFRTHSHRALTRTQTPTLVLTQDTSLHVFLKRVESVGSSSTRKVLLFFRTHAARVFVVEIFFRGCGGLCIVNDIHSWVLAHPVTPSSTRGLLNVGTKGFWRVNKISPWT
jgi:hypothetical protein